MDEDLGKSYRRGYYDENGTYYDALILKDKGKFMSHFQCAYCGTEKKAVWEEGSIPRCDNCGANFTEMYTNPIIDELDSGFISSGSGSRPSGSNDKAAGCLIKAVIGVFLLQFIGGLLVTCASVFAGPILSHLGSSSGSNNKVVNYDNNSYVDDNVERFGTSIYVESIDRTLEWYDEYESYYDPVSDCYVAYNTLKEPYAWQYWYEDISSDYDDYGWMEYELDEDQWYIEIDDGRWIELSSKYDTSELWYITGELAGSSYTEDIDVAIFGNSIADADDLSVVYEWDSDWFAYYNEEYKCYFWYNADYIVEPQWQYNFTRLKGDLDDTTGWFEYDRDEDQWYYETSSGEWEVYEGDTDRMWHIGTSIYCFDTEETVECN